MKRFSLMIALVLTAAMLLSACGGASAPASTQTTAPAPAAQETKAAPEEKTGVYSVYNVTGEKLAELYLYETGSDRGENLVPDGLRNNKMLELSYVGTSDTELTLEFVTAGGYTAKFETLHIEEAPIALLAADAMTGPTPISMTIPEDTGNYHVINTTGETVKELYLYPLGAADKGENLAGAGMEDGESIDFSYTGAVDSTLVVEFTTETDGTKTFETLHIETVNISLLSSDAMTGATVIAFS